MDVKIAVLLILGIHLCESCDLDETRSGCRIRNKQCLCGHGCMSEYRYPTMTDCLVALRGKRSDECNSNPCLHGGNCIQISQYPNFKCRCEGTGYFGLRCDRACPIPGVHSASDFFPYECIVI